MKFFKSVIIVFICITSGLSLSANIDDKLKDSIYNCNIDEVIKCLQKGAKITDEVFRSVIYRNDLSIINLFLEKGAIITDDVFRCAIYEKNLQIINLFLEKGAKITNDVFETAIEENDLSIINLFLEKDTKVNKDVFEATVRYKDLVIAKLLLEKWLEIEANLFEEIDFSDIIQSAIIWDNIEVTKLLLEDIRIVNNLSELEDLFFDVINQGWIDVVKLLLEQETKLGIEERTNGFLKASKLKNGEPIMNLIKSYGINPEAILQGKVRQFIVNDNLNGLIIMNKSGELYFGNTTIVNDLLYLGNYDFMKYCLDNISDEIKSEIDFTKILIRKLNSDDYPQENIQLLMSVVDLKKSEKIEELFFKSAKQGSIELIKLILEERSEAIKMKNKEEAFAIAFIKNHTNITDILIEYGVDPHESVRVQVLQMLQDHDIDALLEKFISNEIDYSKPNIIRTIFRSGEYKLLKYLFENVPELENAFLIGVGFNPHRTERTEGLLEIIEEKIKHIKNAYYVDISLKTLEDEEILQKFSGFINPGGGDSYPRHDSPFNFNEMNSKEMLTSEKIYQKVLEMAMKYDIPYLGICAGAQNLVLKNGGFLKKGGHGGDIEIELIAGTVPHYFFLNEKEKGEMLAECKHGNITLGDAPTAHDYSAYIENLGKGIKLAGVSAKDNIPEAFSVGGNKIGLQFHPEFAIEDAVSPNLHRYHQFYDSVLGMFEGYYHSMQYAKKKGINKEKTKDAFRKINNRLVEYLESCVKKNVKKGLHLHGKNQIRNYKNTTKRISFLPGITPEDLAITRDGDKNLKIYIKDGDSGQLVFLDHYDSSYLKNKIRMEFADGSVMEIDPSRIPLDQSLSGEDFLETNI